MEKICLELPLCKVRDNEPWSGSAYIKEHFPKGCFIIATEYNYRFAWHDGNGYMNEMGIDMNLIQDAIVESARRDVMKEIENRLQQIARLAGECKDEVVTRATVIEDKIDDLGRSGGGGGVNILDVAKSYAVIQKPELIKELK